LTGTGYWYQKTGQCVWPFTLTAGVGVYSSTLRDCEVKFMQQSGVMRMWVVVRFNKLPGAIFYFLAT